MTRFFLFLTLSLLAGLARAQTFFTPGQQWRQSVISTDDVDLSYVARIGSDSVVMGRHYRTVQTTTPEQEPQAFSDTDFLLREEDGKVFARRGETEGLLYDFTAETGDTIVQLSLPRSLSTCSRVVLRTGDTTLRDGICRATYKLNDLQEGGETLIVQGIGSLTHGLYGSPCGGPEDYFDEYLSCVTAGSGDILFSTLPAGSSCMLVSTFLPHVATAAEVYPNPFDEALVLRIPNVTGLRYTLTGVNGAVLLDGRLASGRATLDVSDLPAGVYVLAVRTPAGALIHARVVKQ